MASSDMNLDLIISAQDLASKEIKKLQEDINSFYELLNFDKNNLQ